MEVTSKAVLVSREIPRERAQPPLGNQEVYCPSSPFGFDWFKCRIKPISAGARSRWNKHPTPQDDFKILFQCSLLNSSTLSAASDDR